MSIDSLIIKKFRDLKEMHIPFSLATNMPFVSCDEETYNDQCWIFTSLEAVKEFAERYVSQNLRFRDVVVKKENFKDLFVDFHSMGINELVFCENENIYKLELSDIIRFQENVAVPPNQRPLLNQQLQLSTIYFLQEVRKPGIPLNKEKLEPLAEEMYANLARAQFLLPVIVEKTEESKERLLFPIITDKKGNQFQPVFSDHTQYRKFTLKNKPDDHTRVLMTDISGLQKYLTDKVHGYMLNPEGYCHVINQQQLNFLREHFK